MISPSLLSITLSLPRGTRVKIKRTGRIVGTIRGTYGYGYTVQHDNGTYWPYTENELEKVL
jgi:hypothetical protein